MSIATFTPAMGINTHIRRMFRRPLSCLALLLLGMPLAWAAGISFSNVKIATIKQIVFTEPAISITVGDTITRTAITTLSPGAVTYGSTSEAIARVNSSSGQVTAVAPGEAIITATQAAVGPYPTGAASYRLAVNGQAVAFEQWGLASVTFGAQLNPFQIKAPTSNVSRAGGTPTIRYSTLNNDTSVVSITESGLVTVQAAGDATIVARQEAYGIYSGGTTQTVLKIAAATATFGMPAQEVRLNQTLTLRDPTDSNNKLGAFRYAIVADPQGRPPIATINGKVVTPLASGKTFIRVTQANGGNYAETSVDVALDVLPDNSFKITGFTLTERTYDAVDKNNNVFELPDLVKPTGSTRDYEFTVDETSPQDVATIAGRTVTVNKPGTITIKATLPGDAVHDKVEGHAALTINKAMPVFTLSATSIFTGNASYDIPVSSTNDQTPITLSLQNAQPAGFVTLTSHNGQWTATILKAGSATLIAHQDESDHFLGGTSAGVAFTVTDPPPLKPNTLALAPITKYTNSESFIPEWANAIGDTATIQVAVNNKGPNEVARVNADGRTISLTGLVGEAEVVLTQPSQNGYQRADVPATLTVLPASFEITDFVDVEIPYNIVTVLGIRDFPLPTDLAKPAGSTSNFIFTIDSPGSVASIQGNTLTIHRSGTATITATLPADELRHLEARKQVTLTVQTIPQDRFEALLGTAGIEVSLSPRRKRVLPPCLLENPRPAGCYDELVDPFSQTP